MKSVVDQKGTRYELSGFIGRGGQGAVYGVKGGRLGVKIIDERGPTRREHLKNQLAHVRRLPLGDLCIAKPLEMLSAPHIGYVMELLTGMQPVRNLLKPKDSNRPSVEWYNSEGGLRRRLLLLGRMARILARLHGRGLAYGDPSPSNIFVSTHPGFNEVWFIDSDNLCYEASCGSKLGVYTPFYGAPELVRGKAPVSTLTDIHAFAVLAYQLLVLVHPFIGDYVNDGEPELEEKAMEGQIPWVDDKDDDRNRASFGIPRDFVLSEKIKKLFQCAFGKGRCDPLARPKVSEWATCLYNAADATLLCPGCQSTYYRNAQICPWCGAGRPDFLMVYVYVFDPGFGGHGGLLEKPIGNSKQAVVVDHIAMTNNIPYLLPQRLAFGVDSESQEEPVMEMVFENDYVSVKSVDRKTYRLVSPTGRKEAVVGAQVTKISIRQGEQAWALHFGGKDRLHRVLRFERKQGGIQ